jgi:glutathione-regulated potassium-efflux system ancillary protein KefG
MAHTRKILILYFHPRFENSEVNKHLAECAAGMENVTLRDMYELYPDFHIHVQTEQAVLLDHDIIIWQHPFYWYNCPPLMKQWIDLVLEYGWAYGRNGDKLADKWIFNVVSSGGSFEVYRKDGRNRFTYRELLSPFDQTAYLCKLHYLPPFIVPGANRIDATTLGEYGKQYQQLLRFLQTTEKSAAALQQFEYFNELIQTRHGG